MKKTYLKLLAFTFLILFMAACASSTGASSGGNSNPAKIGTATGTASNGGNAEDLSKYRPKFTTPSSGSTTTTPVTANITPTNHINSRVAAIMDTVASLNKSIRYTQGYRILAYSGTERKAAMSMRTAIVTRLHDEDVHLQYKQPTFRLKVGDYFTRVEAQQSLLQIKDITPNAMIVVDQINVK